MLRPALAMFALVASAAAARAQAPTPTIEAVPSPAGAFVAATNFNLADVGYTQEEFFISGTATAYTNAAPLGSDGLWSVAPGATAAYKTRILVYRPTKPKKFSGTVVVEWLNVSGGVDAAPDWNQEHVELIREGAAWVGVSAQKVGVDGGPALVGVISLPLKQVNPARYGSLVHPGDSFSYDMYSQAGQAVRDPSGPFQGFKVKRVIAAGESQSAFRMVVYVNAVHPIAHVFDGFFIHSRGGGGIFGAPLSETPQPAIATPSPSFIRTDIDVPVLTFQTETDLTFLNFFPARQDDGDNFRIWEVAGTAHYDTYGLVTSGTDVGGSPDVVALVVTKDPLPGLIECPVPINSGPQHFVANAALSSLIRWVRTGKAPKTMPRLDASAGPPVAINTDAHGNALGGVRTPQVDVPVATFTGEQVGGSILCRLFGTTVPFDQATLTSLYPTHKDFVRAYNKAVKGALKAGAIVKADAKLMKKFAASAAIPN
jgi:Alpha/beta hydrolase domain